MIGMLKGKIIFCGEKYAILDVAGVGYKVYALPFTIKAVAAKQGKKDEEAVFWTHLYVRENALDIYGFAERAEVEFFEALISISGIGPKSAMGVMSVAPLDMLKMAIASGEIAYLSKVSGIGRKTAEKIIVELKDKFGKGLGAAYGISEGDGDVIGALESMGYSLKEIREALQDMGPDAKSVEQRIKAALKVLGKH